ncbi:hypothetical protein H5410_031317 [Solanum commersonii]|uniref:CCHC-type domain-containing protein n=1 Tax=Solanum commersonii TaxID=4109 RepID=A0A9J5YGT0_SOLCO|nr:hypothetical protein H5410_031317 [Solanum commersonii]
MEKGGNPHNKKFYRCGKIGHIKKNCRVKLSKVNATYTNEGDEQMKWEQCFSIQVVEQNLAQDFVNYANNNKREEWIVDSGFSHYITGDDSLFSKNVVRIEVVGDKSKSIKLQDVYHVSGLIKNLVSIPQITDSGKYVLFGPNDVKMLENVKHVSANVIFTGEKKGYQTMQQISSKKLVDGLPTLKNIREDVICQVNGPTPSNEEAESVSPSQNISREGDGEHQATRRSTREKKQSDYLMDYEGCT